MRKVLGECGVYREIEGTPLDWELAAYEEGFALLEEGLEEIAGDSFAATAGEEALAQWESRWLPGPCTAPLEDRRAMLAARLHGPRGTVTLNDLPDILLAAGIKGEAEEAGGKITLTAAEYLVPPAVARKELALLLPLHLDWELVDEPDGA